MKRTVLTLAFVGFSAVPASAFLFGGTIVNDITANAHWVTQLQNDVSQIQQFASMVQSDATNLSRLTLNPSAIQADIASIIGQEKSVSAAIAADTAARAIANQSQADAAEDAGFAAAAKAANGAQQQAQVLNSIQLQQLDTQQQALNLQTQQQTQDEANRVEAAGDLTRMTGNEPGTVSSQQL
ncbi:MAG: hypothetical protein ACLPYS_10615 [Vulcanimicrobiaceae bacterium]